MPTVAPRVLVKALARRPGDASELALLYAYPQVAGGVTRWSSTAEKDAGGRPTAEDMRRSVVRRARGIAGRDGAITGSSMYICMLPAMASMYCHQLRLVLQIAASFGHDPADPQRAAEFLVIRGRHSTVEEAAAALAAAPRQGQAADRRADRNPLHLLDQIPSLVGLGQNLRSRVTTRSVATGGLEVASMILPFIGIPIWSAMSARSTRLLAQQAIRFYQSPPAPAAALPAIPLAAPARSWSRGVAALIVALMGALFGYAVMTLPSLAAHSHWFYVVAAELIIATTFGRLLWITRPPAKQT
ncbi:MAG: hypothetical protein KGQ66_22315 [Acidobacteriota bacterium]|nr:hypothetical protein [Acidobacteriota bacterium]